MKTPPDGLAWARVLASLLALAALPWSAPAEAQAVRPRLMIGFDTSGSMTSSINGRSTYGDGVTTNCSGAGTNASPYCGRDCTAGVDVNCDGAPNDSRMFIARQAVRNVVAGWGELDWALARFGAAQAERVRCDNVNDLECSVFVGSFGNPQCNGGAVAEPPACANDLSFGIPAGCRPGDGGRPEFRMYEAAGSPEVCINYNGACMPGQVLVGFRGLGAFATQDNIPAILRWVDNRETNFVNTTTIGNFCNHAGTGDCELRPSGSTPLGGLLSSIRSYMVPIRNADTAMGCRPYAAILLTDGDEQCMGNPVGEATLLDLNGIRTYVIGFAVDPVSRSQLNAIASAGGTDAPPAGGDTAFFANDPDTLSAALAQIAAESVLVETCDGVDEDCDGRVDEGHPLFCNRPSHPAQDLCSDPGETVCNGVDDNCNGVVDEGLTNACGGCGTPPAETCNRADDDCDGTIDEGVCGACVPETEVCDGIDNDCDTRIDESLTRNCGTNLGQCTAGTQTCSAGTWGACSGIGPSPETCNNRDDDCDGVVDGITRPCGGEVGACQAGRQQCTTGTWGACTGQVGPTPEICDGEDDDCDGAIDENNPGGGGACGTSTGECAPGTLRCMGGALVCTGGVSPAPETCNTRDDDCDGRTDESVPSAGPCGDGTGECEQGALTCVSGSFTCVGGRGPVTEICNGRDDDCDAATDEMNPGGGAVCGTDVGECREGVSRCMGGALVCQGGVAARAEACNALDDDCDGLTDEGNPGSGMPCGGTDVGECERGATACRAGATICVGETGPSAETCNGLDDDCDGRVDEGNPGGGSACGEDTGECVAGRTACMGGALVCAGSVGPVEEVCDGLDNDCDGVEDEGLAVGGACGSDIGECTPGVNICRDGTLRCEGSTDPIAERCNGLDDDCDGTIDERLALGESCGGDVGACETGLLTCVRAELVCSGSVPPARERCSCQDEDCDGAIDELPDGATSICPGDSECVGCQCALECLTSEFGFTCPSGRSAVEQPDGRCFCLAELCDEEACGEETISFGGELLCAPGSADVARCTCRSNECTFRCDGVTCDAGTVCAVRGPDAGRCVEDTCRTRGCPSGELCDFDTGECQADPCLAAGCAAEQACRAGTCEPSCATTECAAGEICRRGVCEVDLCADGCAAEQTCDPGDGSCVDFMCEGVVCPAGTRCDQLTGECRGDPCVELQCPEDQVCERGECALDPSIRPPVDAGGRPAFDAGPAGPGPDLVSVGGSGCVCRAGASAGRSGGEAPVGGLLLLLGLVVLGRRRRRRRGPARARGAARLALGAGLLSLLAAGCEVEPYCIDNCGGDAGMDAATADAGDAGPPDAPMDAGTDAAPDVDGCVEGASERCNERDDDCDGLVDEGIDTSIDPSHCGGCGMSCDRPGALYLCEESACQFVGCDVGYHDLDADPDNGCEYRCLESAEDDAVCDRRDDDCDDIIDEDVDFDADPENCGMCGRRCRFQRASASCVAGECALGACEPNFYDADGRADNGCEYACVLASPPDETCNGVDDDCDRIIDEGDPGGGGACGSDVGECALGVERCVGGSLSCTGGTTPVTETCNGVDDDCDGATDESDPNADTACGPGTGVCAPGRRVCRGGALECDGAVGPVAEACNGLDDDCDGSIDEMNPEGGASCGDDTGFCASGTMRCRGGVLTCEGAIGPRTEVCNGLDDDCDGATDENNPGGGMRCGTDVGQCTAGSQTCTAGSPVCQGSVGPSPERCNSLDDDCDGRIDEGNPEGGTACGPTTGACEPGMRVCLGGTLQCMGGTGPTLEACNGLDDDCDARTDETFDTSRDIDNCGSCGTSCRYPNAVTECNAGSCRILSCQAGFVNADGDAMNGCEYACDFNGAEVCNARDDDCDRRVDEGLTPPPNLCNPNGVCAGTSATCTASGWTCAYPSTREDPELSCDGLDNDCDGSVDEPYPLIGTSCSNGIGACRRTGVYVCNSTNDGAVCGADPAGTPVLEMCNNRDDDCDTRIDENISVAQIPAVRIPQADGSGFVRIFQYEASRPDASTSSAGSLSSMACSQANVLPWTDLTWLEARDACCALNPSGNCSTTGWQLCRAEDWEDGCQGSGAPCAWSYSSACTRSAPTVCNGREHDCDPARPDDQDCLYPTASSTFPGCYTPYSGGGRLYDLSGNVREWTSTERGSANREIRGGGYDNPESGRRCDFNFTVADAMTFSSPNTGFRCCYYE